MGRGNSGLSWDDVRVSFSDSNQAMGNAQNSLSSAGNVFDKITQTILNERQRATENQLKRDTFNEGVRQYDTTLGENQRQFGITSAETARGHDLTYDASIFGNLVQARGQDVTADTANRRLMFDQANEVAKASETVPIYGAGGIAQGPVGQTNYSDLVNSTSSRTGVPAHILNGMIKQESGGDPNAVSPTGVTGIAQVTIPVMEKYGYTAADRNDPIKSADAGAKYLNDLYGKYGNWEDALVAYNGGDGAVQGIKTGTFPASWKAEMRRQGIDPEQKIKEVQGYAKMANNLVNSGNIPSGPQLSAKGKETARINAEREAVNKYSLEATQAITGLSEQIKNYDTQLRDINAISGTTEGDALEGTKQEIMTARNKAAADAAKASTESGRELLFLQKLEEAGYGALAADLRAKRAAEERQHARTIDTEKLRANAKWTQSLVDWKKNEDKAALGTAKILSGIEDGVIGGKYGTEARTALSIARSLKRPDGKPISEQDIFEAFSSFSTKDDNWFFDTPMQDAIQQFNENQTGPFAEALKYSSSGSKKPTPSNSSDSSTPTPKQNPEDLKKEASVLGVTPEQLSDTKYKERVAMFERDKPELERTANSVRSAILATEQGIKDIREHPALLSNNKLTMINSEETRLQGLRDRLKMLEDRLQPPTR